MKKIVKIIISLILYFSFINLSGLNAQEMNVDNCWRIQRYTTLLDTMLKVMLIPIEDTYKQHDFIQTFGCGKTYRDQSD